MTLTQAIERLTALRLVHGDVAVVFLEPCGDGVMFLSEADFDAVRYVLPDGEKKTLVYMLPSESGDNTMATMGLKEPYKPHLKLVPP